MKKTLLFFAMIVAVLALVAQPKFPLTFKKATAATQAPEEKNQMFDNVESYLSWLLNPESKYWTWLDPRGEGTYGITGQSFENSNQPSAFIVFNNSQSDPPSPRLEPYSGKKCFISFADVTAHAANKWLMTKELIPDGGTMTFSFYAKSLTAQYGLERFIVWTSTTTNEQAAFTNMLTPGTYVEAPIDYTHYSYTVPTGTKFVGLQCVSFDAFGFMVDDVKFEGAHVLGGEDPLGGCEPANAMRVETAATGYDLAWNSPANNYDVLSQAGAAGTSIVGYGEEFGFYHRFSTTDLAAFVGRKITRLGFEPVYSSTQDEGQNDYTLLLYKGGYWAADPGDRFAGQEVFSRYYGKDDLKWNTLMKIDIEPLTITGTEEIWFGCYTVEFPDAAASPALFDETDFKDEKGNLMYVEDFGWITTAETGEGGTNNWFLKAYLVIPVDVPVNIYRNDVMIKENYLGQQYFDETTVAPNTCYYVRVICDEGPISDKTNIACGVGVTENKNPPCKIYPNPTNSTLFVESVGNYHTIEVINFLGQVVASQRMTEGTNAVNVSNLNNGVYFVRLISSNGTTVQKFVKN